MKAPAKAVARFKQNGKFIYCVPYVGEAAPRCIDRVKKKHNHSGEVERPPFKE